MGSDRACILTAYLIPHKEHLTCPTSLALSISQCTLFSVYVVLKGRESVRAGGLETGRFGKRNNSKRVVRHTSVTKWTWKGSI